MQWKKRFQNYTNLVSKKTIPLLTQFFFVPLGYRSPGNGHSRLLKFSGGACPGPILECAGHRAGLVKFP